tara:strand:- start:350 stop:1006 length:657 start_codon:yes stop_codon:yes gene_type:complete
MKHKVRTAAAAAAITVSSLVGSVETAQAYQVDCAILLCLAGGWPASAPCAHARAVFIRRITPWPIEPPLQIWRCPMGASLNAPAPLSPMERLYDITFRNEPWVSIPEDLMPLVQVQSDEQADIDISGDAFDFVRSIRVFHIQLQQERSRGGECITSDYTRRGKYGSQGSFIWSPSKVADVPQMSALTSSSGCRNYTFRAVFVDWRDHAGTYGFEEVRY